MGLTTDQPHPVGEEVSHPFLDGGAQQAIQFVPRRHRRIIPWPAFPVAASSSWMTSTAMASRS